MMVAEEEQTANVVVGILAMGVALVANIFSGMMYLSPWRTIREVWDTQSVEDLAFQPFVAMAAHSMLWAMYASMIRDIALTASGMFGVVCSIYYCWAFYVHIGPDDALRESFHLHVSIGALSLSSIYFYLVFVAPPAAAVLHMGLICSLAAGVLFTAPVLKLVQVIQTGDTNGVPMMLVLTSGSSCLCWAIYGFLVDDFFLKLLNGCGALFSATQLLLFLIFRRRTRLIADLSKPKALKI